METLKRTADPVETEAKRFVPAKTVQESEVGITQYINPSYKSGGGFYGTIKQRYSDFQVFEIGLDDKVTHLLDEGVAVASRKTRNRQAERADLQNLTPEEVEQVKKEKAETPVGDAKPKYILSETNRTRLLDFVTPEELQEIEELFGNGGNMETKTAFSDKAQRTQLHQLFRQAFQGKLETLTSAENTFKVALAKSPSGEKASRRNNNVNHVDDDGVVNYGLGPFKNYLHFTVYKENRETMEVASTITKFLRVPHKAVKYAGTKDRRGVTCQRFAIHKGKVARVTTLNKGLKGAVLGGFSYEDKSLDLGDLHGNEFLIAIRDVAPLSDQTDIASTVKASFESLEQKGFINYFGMQRFGTFSISTHVLGIKLLNEDWQGAVDLLLAEQERVVPDSVEARRIWATTKDAAEAAKAMPRRCGAESAVLNQLAQEKRIDGAYSENAYFKALMQIPRNLRLIYVHAYQSYIWNMVALKRIELQGLKAQVGDLVMVEEKSMESRIVVEEVDGEDFAEDVAGQPSDKVRPLTEEDIALERYTIYDVVLPTPGYDVVYPTNPELLQTYEKYMAQDGLDPHKMARRIKEFSLLGSYRLLMGRASDLLYDIVKYKESAADLLRTDLEILRHDGEMARVVESDPDGERTAVILRMKLGVSSYATMALREFMKADTSRLSPNFDVKV